MSSLLVAVALLVPLAASAPAASAASAADAAPPPAAAEAPAAPLAADEPPPFSDADLAPVFPEGPLARAAADLDAGRPQDTARALEHSPFPPARYLAAVALLQTSRHADALQRLAGLEADLPDLADRIAFRRGQALDAAARRREAAAEYGRVPAGSVLRDEARLAQARALDAAGDARGALAALQPLLADADRGPAGAEALLLAGGLRARGREFAAARRAWVQCWAQYPLSPAANDCQAALRTLPAPHAAQPATEDALRRAEALLDEHRNAAAARELEKALPRLGAASRGAPLACRARFALGKAYRKERQHTKAIAELVSVVERCDDPALRVKALYVLGSASSIASPPDGLRRYRQLAAEYPSHPFADDALYFSADLLARDGQLAEARAALLELAARYPDGDFRAEALFRAAWLANRIGDLDGALAGLAALEELAGEDAYEHARAGYWRARLVQARGADGDVAAARAIWLRLVERYPADWYGLLARARLAETGGAPEWPQALLDARASPPATFRYRTGALREDRHFRAGVLLLRMGQRAAAAEELSAVDRRLVAVRGDPGAEPLLLLAELLDRAGDHQRAHHLVRSGAKGLLRGSPDGSSLRVWRIAYPNAFREDIERWSGPAGVDADLLQALMREESALDPRVVSHAGAVGLTQLMPATAQDVARRLKLRKPSPQDLMDGSLNIRLGAAYLGTLVERFGGSYPLAVAAYNVGDAPVRRWMRDRGTLPLDEFVEEIPVQETRGYVKRVLRSYAAYRVLYGAKPGAALVVGQALPRLQ